MSDLPRRRLLTLTGAATTAAIAGCSSDDGEGEDEESEPETNETDEGDQPDAEAEPEEESETDVVGSVLGDITVQNLHDETHAIDVIVEFDREIEHWSSHELDAGDGTTLERDWPTDPGSFRVTARLDGGEPTQITAAKWNDPDCLNLFALVTRDGDLEIWSDTGGGPCGSGDAEPTERNDE